MPLAVGRDGRRRPNNSRSGGLDVGSRCRRVVERSFAGLGGSPRLRGGEGGSGCFGVRRRGELTQREATVVDGQPGARQSVAVESSTRTTRAPAFAAHEERMLSRRLDRHLFRHIHTLRHTDSPIICSPVMRQCDNYNLKSHRQHVSYELIWIRSTCDYI